MVIDYLEAAEVYKQLKHMPLAKNIETDIHQRIWGRIASEQDNAAIMACFAAIEGDHLEIGTLHGGTAILVAWIKQELKLSGQVVCIDPLDGYYLGMDRGEDVDPLTKVPVSIETLHDNITRFDLQDKIEVIQKKSSPFPLKDRRFTSAYIDGDHWGDMPMVDWQNVSRITDRYVIFDNCDKEHPSVLDACLSAAFTSEWTSIYRQGITCVFERF
jgi:hypothetical protein